MAAHTRPPSTARRTPLGRALAVGRVTSSKPIAGTANALARKRPFGPRLCRHTSFVSPEEPPIILPRDWRFLTVGEPFQYRKAQFRWLVTLGFTITSVMDKNPQNSRTCLLRRIRVW